jgi:hypothetical protein
MKHPSALLVTSALLLAACGGKILDERGGGAPSSGAGAPSTSSDEATPAPQRAPGLGSSSPSPAPRSGDPCTTICESNGGCVGGQQDCIERCAEDLLTPSCGAEARAYLGCYADNVQFCSQLPPACEGAYCAYTRCAGKVVPSYCR